MLQILAMQLSLHCNAAEEQAESIADSGHQQITSELVALASLAQQRGMERAQETPVIFTAATEVLACPDNSRICQSNDKRVFVVMR